MSDLPKITQLRQLSNGAQWRNPSARKHDLILWAASRLEKLEAILEDVRVEENDFVLVDEMRKSRERLRRVVGVDGYDLDLITWAVERIEKLQAALNSKEENDV